MTCNIQDIGKILKIKFGYLVLPPERADYRPRDPLVSSPPPGTPEPA